MVRRFPTFVLAMFCAVTLFGGFQSLAQDDESAKQKTSSENLLPASTKAWVSVPNLDALQKSMESTQFGKLTQDEKLKPFIDSIRSQLENWLNEKNVRLGLKIDEVQAVRTGEICIAGVLQGPSPSNGEKLGRGSHGMVLLVNVAGSETETEELLAKVAEDFKARGAVKDKMDDIHGVKVNKWKIERKRIRGTQHTFQAIANGWLVASDNEKTIREILRRLVDSDYAESAEKLATQAPFVSVMENTSLDVADSHGRWYISPFGYIQLAQAIEDEDQPLARTRRNDRANILKNEGFDAFKGIGGQFAIATKSHEILHRSFVYAPKTDLKENQKRVFGLFDFENKNKHPLSPPNWVPSDISTFASVTWDVNKAFANLGFVIDAFMDPGTFEETINSLREDPAYQVDIRELMKTFGDRVTVVSATKKPIGEESELIVLALPIVKGKEDDAFNGVYKAMGKGNAQLINLGGNKVIEQDTSPEAVEKDILEDTLNLDIDDGTNELATPEEEEFRLFEKRYIAVSKETEDGFYLLISNNKDYLKRLLGKTPKTQLDEADDFGRVKTELAKLTNEEDVSLRLFGRSDKSLEANYELLRQGKMVASNTVLARVLNRALTPADDLENDKPRDQKLDGQKLPSDFEKDVAPYLGPMGWVVETTDQGWRLTGCMLKKKQISEVVQKANESTRR